MHWRVRIATGSTRTADEVQALRISEDNEVLLEDSDEVAGGGNKEGADSDLDDSFMTDDSNISDNESEQSLDEQEWTKKIWQEQELGPWQHENELRIFTVMSTILRKFNR